MTPQRIQLSRAKGWRKPEGAVLVSRPSRWGNPYSIVDIGRAFPSLSDLQCQRMAVRSFEALVRNGQPVTLSIRQVDGRRNVVTYTYPSLDEIRADLRGRDLACWCELSWPCHADVLLEVANS